MVLAVAAVVQSAVGGNAGFQHRRKWWCWYLQASITGSSVTYGGGGGGGGGNIGGTGGTGGSGGGANGSSPSTGATTATANRGGGGGGGTNGSGTASGGSSGIVIISVPTASYSGTTTGSPTVTTSGGNTIMQFTASGTYTG
jgi:hypothetical protein